MGKFLVQGGGSLLTQGGGHLLVQGSVPAPAIAGSWPAPYAIGSGYYFPAPSARPLQASITNTAGDWLFALVAWRPTVAGSGVSFCVADDAHNWWEPLGAPNTDSGAAGNVRVGVWAAPAARVTPGGTTIVQVAPTGPYVALAALIVDVSGILPWMKVAALVTNFANSASALSLSAAAPSAQAILFSLTASDNNSDTITGPSGWTALTTVTASNGVDHTADITLTPAWQLTSSSSSSSVSSTGSLDLAGAIAGVIVSAPAPAQPNPNWPVTITEVAIGAGVTTPPSQVTWTDMSARALALSVKQGRQYALGQVSAGQGTITIDNWDGAFYPPGSGAFAGIDSGTPLRRRLIIPSLPSPHFVTFNGFLRRLPWTVDASTYRGQTTAEVSDVWAYGSGTLNSMAIEECLIDEPYALWPCTDPAGSASASNLAPGNSLPLTQALSKYGAGGATAAFGANSGMLAGAASAKVTSSGTSSGGSGMWEQTLAGESLSVGGLGYCLACTDPGFPPISAGVTAETYFQWNGPDTPVGSISFTAAVSGSTISTSSSIPAGSAVIFSVAAGFTFPTGITAGVVYYVLGSGGSSFQVSTSYGGAAATITVAGSGWIQEFIPWDPVVLSLRDAQAVPVVEIDVRNTDGALLIAQRTSTTTRNVTVLDSSRDYRVAGLCHVSLSVTQTTYRVLVNGGGLLNVTGSFSPALPASFREFTMGGIQDSTAHGWALPGSFSFAGIYPGVSSQQRVLNRYWATANGMVDEAANDRIERVLEYAGLTGRRWLGQQLVLEEGDLCASGQDVGGQASVSSIGNIAQSTLPAMLYVAPTGDTVYRSKLYVWNEDVKWVLGDNVAGGEIPFLISQFSTDYDPTRVTEDIQLTQLDVSSVTVPSGVMASATMAQVTAATARQYGGAPYQQTGYLALDYNAPYAAGSSLVDLANWLANVYKKPQNRVQAVTVEAAANSANLSSQQAWAFFAGASSGDMVQVNVRPPTAPAGTVIAALARVTQTQRSSQFSQGGTSAKIACTLDFAPEYNCLTCDDPVRGLLNGVNLLGWLRLRPARSAARCTGTSGRAASARARRPPRRSPPVED